MGTSQSSSGSPSGVPMVPPWVPSAPDPSDNQGGAPDGAPDGQDGDDGSGDSGKANPQPSPVAPSGRFTSARRNLGNFARTGSADDMRKGIAQYVRKGLGGTRTAARRFGGTAQTAGSLFGALSSAAAGQPAAAGSPLDPAVLRGRTADEIMDAVVEAVRPIDGTQDTEASRHAINDALSDVLDRYPDADLLSLSEEQRLFAVERYIALDVFNRFDLDVGQHLRENAPSIKAELSRFREVKDYIRETVSAAFRKFSSASGALTRKTVNSLVRSCLQEAFEVFEGYLS